MVVWHWITDVIALPQCQAQGLEQEMATEIRDFLRDQLRPGFGSQVDVRSGARQEALYAGGQLSTQERQACPCSCALPIKLR